MEKVIAIVALAVTLSVLTACDSENSNNAEQGSTDSHKNTHITTYMPIPIDINNGIYTLMPLYF